MQITLTGRFRIANRERFERRLESLEASRDPRACFYRVMKETDEYAKYERWVGPLKAWPVGRKDGPFSGHQEILYARKTGWITDV
jgi:hypothetical protein